MKLLILDLNETLIESKDKENVFNWIDNWKFKPRILSSIYNEYFSNDYQKVVIYTNQAGIDEGVHTPNEILIQTRQIEIELETYFSIKRNNIPKIDTIISPSKLCEFRKPNTEGFLDLIALDTIELDNDSLFIGDASGKVREKFVKKNKDFEKFVELNYDQFPKKVGKEEERLFKGNVMVRRVGTKSESNLETHIPSKGIIEYHKIFKYIKDFSDSDKKFAENLGINYLDVDDFINKWHGR